MDSPLYTGSISHHADFLYNMYENKIHIMQTAVHWYLSTPEQCFDWLEMLRFIDEMGEFTCWTIGVYFVYHVDI